MRRWIAALAFVPALAWGQSDLCFSVEEREVFTRIALGMQGMLERGATERDLFALVQPDDLPEMRAAAYEAIAHLTNGRPMSVSGVVSAMQLACHRAIPPPPPR